MEYMKASGDCVVNAATEVYEKMCESNESFKVSLVGEAYEDGYTPDDPDHNLYFLNALVVANAGDHTMSKALKELEKKIIKQNDTSK
jgi:hypothetical protein